MLAAFGVADPAIVAMIVAAITPVVETERREAPQGECRVPEGTDEPIGLDTAWIARDLIAWLTRAVQAGARDPDLANVADLYLQRALGEWSRGVEDQVRERVLATKREADRLRVNTAISNVTHRRGKAIAADRAALAELADSAERSLK